MAAGRRSIRAYPSAAPEHTPSNKQRMLRISGTRSSAETNCISEVPGFIKHVSTPWATRVRRRHSAPVILFLPVMHARTLGSNYSRVPRSGLWPIGQQTHSPLPHPSRQPESGCEVLFRLLLPCCVAICFRILNEEVGVEFPNCLVIGGQNVFAIAIHAASI